VFVAAVEFDLLLADHVASLKQRRGVVKPLQAELERRFGVVVADVSGEQRYRRVQLGAAVVAAAAGHAGERLDAVERFVADRPELELLSAHRRLWSMDDD